MTRIPIPDQPRVSLLTSKEWARRWRARGDSRMDLAFAPDTVRAIAEDYAWGSVTWEVTGLRTDTRPGRYITPVDDEDVTVAHRRARDLVAPQLTAVESHRMPTVIPLRPVIGGSAAAAASTLALTQVTWGPIEATLIGAAALATVPITAARAMRRRRRTRVRPVEAIGNESVVYEFLGIGARTTAEPHLGALLTETLREVIDDVEHVTSDVTATRLATIRAALPAPVVPARALDAQDQARSAAIVAAEQAEIRRAYVDARVDAVAELVTAGFSAMSESDDMTRDWLDQRNNPNPPVQ